MKIEFCAICLEMQSGERHWIADFMTLKIKEISEVIERFLIENPDINEQEIARIIVE